MNLEKNELFFLCAQIAKSFIIFESSFELVCKISIQYNLEALIVGL
jgi:hypothetical protein